MNNTFNPVADCITQAAQINKPKQGAQIMKQTIMAIAGCALAFAINGTNQAHAAEVIKPQIGEPLRDAAVTRATDGTFYMVGTRTTTQYQGKPDFMSNDGIKLWSSKDLKTWKDEGMVWKPNVRTSLGDWRLHGYALPDRPYLSPTVHGETSPRIQCVGGRWIITESVCGHDVGWLGADKPTGPYKVVYKEGYLNKTDMQWKSKGRFSWGPGYGSLFEDGGTVYLVKGQGYIAKVSSSLTAIEGEFANLLCAVEGYPNAAWCAEQFSPRGAFVHKVGGKFVLLWAAATDKDGTLREDTFAAVSDSLFGPYSAPVRLIPGGGPAVLFDAGERGLMAACSMEDKPALIPVRMANGVLAAEGVATPQSPALAKSAAPKMFDYAHSKPTGKRYETHAATGRSVPVPVFDLPLTEIAICRGGDGQYYMTGGAASIGKDGQPDFQNNDGVYLWKSADLATWLPMGKVWDIVKDAAQSPKSAWQLAYRIPADNPTEQRLCRGITAPEIHYADGAYYIPYSMNARGTGLLRSKTGKPEGPYEDLGRLTAMGGAPSLFTDDDQSAWWLWDDLKLARLQADHQSLDGKVIPLLEKLAHVKRAHTEEINLWDACGPHLFTAAHPKTKKRQYYLSFSAITQKHERANRETIIAGAENIVGPYGAPMPMMNQGGQTSVFRDADGKMFASFYGADPFARFRDRPSLVPMEWCRPQFNEMPRKVEYDFYTHRGPWHEIDPLLPLHNIRDPRMDVMPDGCYYWSASMQGNQKNAIGYEPWADGGIPYWRSKDLKNWEYLGQLYDGARVRNNPDWPNLPDQKIWGGDTPNAWEPAMTFHNGHCYLVAWMTGVKPKQVGGFVLKSQSADPKGPYQYHAMLTKNPGLQQIFVDTDGQAYFTHDACGLARLNQDFTGPDPEWEGDRGKGTSLSLKLDDGNPASEDCGYNLHKIGDTYVFGGLTSTESYDGRFSVSKNIRGPYRYVGTLPCLGNSNMFKSKEGKWYANCDVAHSSFISPWPEEYPFLYEVHVDMKSDPPVICPVHDVPAIGHSVY